MLAYSLNHLLLLLFHSEVVNPNSKIDEEGELRTDLINLLERSQEHLTPKQSSEVKRLLKKYEGLFAASDSIGFIC
jgi:hypothetical protein